MPVREATVADRPAILAIATELSKQYPGLKKDVEKMHGAITEVITSPKYFSQVSEIDGEIKGVILCITQEHMWAQRKTSNVVLWYSGVPGEGVKLLRAYRAWIKRNRAVKIAGMCPDTDLSPRTLRIAELVGFEKHGGSYLLYN